jgi:hypothetical protein
MSRCFLLADIALKNFCVVQVSAMVVVCFLQLKVSSCVSGVFLFFTFGCVHFLYLD